MKKSDLVNGLLTLLVILILERVVLGWSIGFLLMTFIIGGGLLVRNYFLSQGR